MEKTSVFSVTSKMVFKLNALTETPVGKSTLAKFRNSIGKNLLNYGLYSLKISLRNF